VNRIRKTDYTESREFVFKLDEVGRDLGKSISSIFKKRIKTEPKTLGERIRFLYSSFLEINIRKGIYKKGSQTHREIEEKSLLYAKEAPDDIMHLTDVYEKARYSDNMLNEDDFDIAESSLKKIKDIYEN
jgi:hypothetical protein